MPGVSWFALPLAACAFVHASEEPPAQRRTAAVAAYAEAARERKERRTRQREELQDAAVFTVRASLDARFHAADYWQDFYRQPGNGDFEWYNVSLAAFRAEFAGQVPSGSRLLHAGCGTSTLAEDLWKEGWREAVHCDADAEAISILRTRYAESLPGLAAQLEACDLTSLAGHADGSFDAVFEKGTFDALLAGGWRSREELGGERPPAAKALSELLRVLRPGGVLVSITVYEPEERLDFLNSGGGMWRAKLLARLKDHGSQDVLIYCVSQALAVETTAREAEL